MTIAAIGRASIVFAMGVLSGKISGASWRWSSVFTITNMAVFGLLLYAQKRVLTTHLISIQFFAQSVNMTLGMGASIYLANKLVKQKPTYTNSASYATLAAIGPIVLFVDLISKDVLFTNW